MNKGKLIIIEGTDCSGKETQSNMLKERLINDGFNVYKTSFPQYETPTGKIIGGPYLGKSYIGEGWFPEGAPNVDALVASSFFAADRRYNMPIIKEYLEKGYIVLLDRYVESNMAHQGGKIIDFDERHKMYQKLDNLEFGIMELPRPDKIYLLYMPYKFATMLRKNRVEEADQHESDPNHLQNAERAYLELAEIYNFDKIDCTFNDSVKSIANINDELYTKVRKLVK